jgi:putative glutamine amidotransferase
MYRISAIMRTMWRIHMTKLICVTPRIIYENGIQKQFVNTRYIDRLTERGANTVMLTLNNPNQDEILSICDGFLVTGGWDLDPKSYGETNEAGLSENIHESLDQIDKEVIHYAINHRKPLLGICRGHQSLNVFLGGTLHQHITGHESLKYDHLLFVKEDQRISFTPIITVNSFHHQAIKDLASSLDVLATHQDGTIEMVYHKHLPIFSVQWHPEMIPNDPISKIVFDTFIKLIP